MEEKASVEHLNGATNVVRYVGGSSYDPSTGKIDGGAFDRKEKDTDGLSFTARGILAADSDSDKDRIREVFASRMKVGKTACFAELNIKAVQETLADFGDDFYFYLDPLPEEDEKLANPAHCILNGLPFMGEQLGSLKSEQAGDLLKTLVLDVFSAMPESKEMASD